MNKVRVIIRKLKFIHLTLAIFFLSLSSKTFCQNTIIRGFVDATATYQKDKLSFNLGEQDLFITSEVTDRLSFLGETVFRFDPFSHTNFTVSVERIVLKYNFWGNHNLLLGKHHTPLNYWNDTYHHGRLFFPTINRPLLFPAQIIPLHTTGLGIQGYNLGTVKFGYDVMIGNGLGSSDVLDNDKNKSLTAAVHIKPVEKLRIGASYYRDVIGKGATVQQKTINWKVVQHLYTGSVAYFGKKFEVLAESTLGTNKTDTTGTKHTIASYLYGGYRIKEKIIPYIRVDNINYQSGEILFTKNNTTAFVAGLRYQLNYLAVVKLEYQYEHSSVNGTSNNAMAQLAIGF